MLADKRIKKKNVYKTNIFLSLRPESKTCHCNINCFRLINIKLRISKIDASVGRM